MARNYEQTLFNYIDSAVRYMKIQPLLLGGVAGSGGGIGSPPGGFIGYLPQSRIAYDESELAVISTDDPPSLLDNLNHIRFRMATLEAITSGGSVVKQDGVIVSNNVVSFDFQDIFDVQVVSPGEVAIYPMSGGVQSDVSYSGVFGENLSAQISGVNNYFTVANDYEPNSLSVYLNGLRQDTSDVIVVPSGFYTSFIPNSGDVLSVDYQTSHSGYFHTHSQYALDSDVYTIDEIDSLLDTKADLEHFHVIDDITDYDYDAHSIWGIPVVSGANPTNNQTLVYRDSSLQYELATVEFEQQILFPIAESDLQSTGIKPFRIYIHDVGTEAIFTKVYAYLSTAPSSTSVKIDVLKNGSSIFNPLTPITISVGNNSYSTTEFDINTLQEDDYLQIEILQTDTSANYLTVHIRFKRSLF